VKPVLYLSWLTGLGLFVGVITYQGLNDVAAALATTGWGLVWITAFHLAPLAADVIGWRALLPASQPRPLLGMTWMRWICESVNCLLPVAQVGGDLVRARLLNQVGVPGPLAGATVIVDIMAGMLTLVIFAAVGTVLLLLQFGAAQAALELCIRPADGCALPRPARLHHRLRLAPAWLGRRCSGGLAGTLLPRPPCERG
jgi:hypothetical protein